MVFRLFTADFWAKAKATSSGQGGHAAAKATASAQLPEFASDIFSLSQRKTHINPPFVVSMGNIFFWLCAANSRLLPEGGPGHCRRGAAGINGLVGLRINLQETVTFTIKYRDFPVPIFP